MDSFTVTGVVLKEVRYKEADAIVTLLTAEKGIITASAKGIYKSGSKNRAGIQLFCYSEFEMASGKGGYIIKSAHLKELFFDIRSTSENYALACYISEVVSSLCTSENGEEEALRLTLNTLASLNIKENCKPLWQIKAAFELKICCICGFSPMLNACGECGCAEEDSVEGNADESFIKNNRYLFSMEQCALICTECFTAMLKRGETVVTTKLTRAGLYAARFVCDCPINRFLSFKLADDDVPEFADFAEKYLLYIAERSFVTLKCYKQLIHELGNTLRQSEDFNKSEIY